MQQPSAAKRALQFASVISLAISFQTSPSLAQSGSGSILIGDLQPVTGPGGNSALTQSVTQGVKSAISDLNAHGGATVGGKKYEFTYKAIDTRSEPAATLAAAKELIQDNAVAAILPALAGTEIAYRALSEGKVISFTSAPRGMNPLALDPTDKHPYLFATIELTDPVIEGWLGAILSLNPGVKRVAVLNLTDPGGKLMDAGVQRAAHKLGLEYVGAEFVDISTTDFSGSPSGTVWHPRAIRVSITKATEKTCIRRMNMTGLSLRESNGVEVYPEMLNAERALPYCEARSSLSTL